LDLWRVLRSMVLPVLVLVVLAPACDGGTYAGAGDDPPPESSGAPAPGSSRPAPPATVSPGGEDRSPAGARGAPAQAEPGSGGGRGGPSYQTPAGQNYWATDWCHYYVSRGTWIGDVCVRVAVDGRGQTVPNLYNLYRYPGAGRALGDPVRQISATDARYTIMRNLEDPFFNIVQWARWPAGTQPMTATLELEVVDGRTNTYVWLPAPTLMAEVSAGNGARYGITTPAGGSNRQNTFEIPDTSKWSSANTTINDLVAGMGGSINARMNEPNCQLPGVTCYYHYGR
jgi:hypothetical protein